MNILSDKRKLLEKLSEELLVKETLDAEEIFKLSLPFISGSDKEIVENQFLKIKAINDEIKKAEEIAKKEAAKKKAEAEKKKKLREEKAKKEAAEKAEASEEENKQENPKK